MMRSFLFALIGLAFGCRGQVLDLGLDVPTGPPRTADGAADETVPWAIAPRQYGAHVLALAQSRLYWASTSGPGETGEQFGAVKGCSLADCAATVVTYAIGQGYVASIVVADGILYWNNDAPRAREGNVVSCPVAGCVGPPSIRLRNVGIGSPFNFAVDRAFLYWGSYQDSAIFRCPLSGCGETPEVVAVLDGPVVAMSSDDSTLYFSIEKGPSKEGVLQAVPKDGSAPPRVIAAGQDQPASIALDAERVYWTNAVSSGKVSACPISGCTSDPTILCDAQRKPNRIVVDRRNAYFVTPKDETNLGAVLECPLTGCGTSPKVLADGQPTNGNGLAVDDTHVFWTNEGHENGSGNDLYFEGDVSRVGK